MGDINSILEEIQKYDKDPNLDLIRKAYEFAKRAHEGQKRDSGEEYLIHPVEVARILTEFKGDSATLAAAFLHDVIEEKGIDIKEIQKQFGEEVAQLVDGVTKSSKVAFESLEEYKAENLRKILIATTKDIRVILIKLADRLHNMRTLEYSPKEKQLRMAKETMDIYAPIAHKLGIHSIKGELEDLALRFLEPESYAEIKKMISEHREEREQRAKVVMEILKQKLKQEDIEVIDISGRAKYFYSIYRKVKAGKRFEDIHDLMAIRIVVKTIPECYQVMAIAHQIWTPIPGRFKDYIAVPKSNGYQSLHTDVVTPGGTSFEIQARTIDMDKTAKFGVAAHWKYKGTERDKEFDKRISWLEQILEWRRRSSHEFLDSFKVELFQNEIVVFTPKGDPIILPENATPLDFAYAVHTDVGDHCQRAEVNKKIIPLDGTLKSGDIINILTSNKAVPSRNWMNIVKTPKAKQKIRVALNIEGEERVPERKEDRIDIAKYIGSDEKGTIKTAKCCSPNFQDDIVAFKTKEGSISVHKKSCSNVPSIDLRKINVNWNIPNSLVKTIFVYVDNEFGMVEKVLDTIVDLGLNALSVNMKPHGINVAIAVKVKADSIERTNKAFDTLKTMPHVMSVRIE